MAKPTNDYNYNQIKVKFEIECTFSTLNGHPLIEIFNRIPEEDQLKVLRGTLVDTINSQLNTVNRGGSFVFLRSIK